MKRTYIIPQQRVAVLEVADGMLASVSNVQMTSTQTTDVVEVKEQEINNKDSWDNEW